MRCNSAKLPLLLERVGVRRIKSTGYIPLIPAFFLKGEGAPTCVDIFASEGGGNYNGWDHPFAWWPFAR